jgi:hypothetical protein
MLNSIDNEAVSKFKDKGIKHRVDTKLEFSINIAGTEFNSIEEAINHAYRCGLAAVNQPKKSKETGALGAVDQDELYRILKKSNSIEHKADFLKEIANEWFPIEPDSEKKIKKVHFELIEMAEYLTK